MITALPKNYLNFRSEYADVVMRVRRFRQRQEARPVADRPRHIEFLGIVRR